ncbi:MAG: TetR/AcrR family transcriptional regulator [Candidatus Malihini olakiniferum]
MPQTKRYRGPSKNRTEQTRKKIISATLDMFMNQGFSDARVADICKKADVTKGFMYNYFQTKESLFEGVL